MRDGKPVDTSMGFTPTAGVPMSTRSGDLDPGLVWYLARSEKMSAKQFNEMVNFQSGLLGISETSSDMRDLMECEAQDVRAAEAVALFCYQVKKWVGAFAAALGGLDTLVFAGGIGENAAVVRTRICDGLGFLGIELEEKRNAANEGVISAAYQQGLRARHSHGRGMDDREHGLPRAQARRGEQRRIVIGAYAQCTMARQHSCKLQRISIPERSAKATPKRLN